MSGSRASYRGNPRAKSQASVPKRQALTQSSTQTSYKNSVSSAPAAPKIQSAQIAQAVPKAQPAPEKKPAAWTMVDEKGNALNPIIAQTRTPVSAAKASTQPQPMNNPAAISTPATKAPVKKAEPEKQLTPEQKGPQLPSPAPKKHLLAQITTIEKPAAPTISSTAEMSALMSVAKDKQSVSSSSVPSTKKLSGSTELLVSDAFLAQMPSRNALTTPAANTSPSAAVSPEQIAQNYDNVFNYVSSRTQTDLDFSTLGRVSLKPDEYFVKPKTPTLSQQFWERICSKKENRDLLIRNHERKADSMGGQPTHPSCLTLIHVTRKINKETKDFCFVAISSYDKQDVGVWDMFKTEIAEMNKSGTEFVLLKGKIDNINNLINKLNRHKSHPGNEGSDIHKPCAEKFIISTLAKIFMKYGSNVVVNWAQNCDLYPFEFDQRTSMYVSGKYLFPPKEDKVELDVSFKNSFIVISLKPCCQACVMNKNATLSLWKSLQDYGDTVLARPELVKSILATSDPANSTATPTSFFALQPAHAVDNKTPKMTVKC